MRTFRVAGAADRAAVTATICSAFDRDPGWAWLFEDDERRQQQYASWWGVFVDGALRFPWVRVTAGCEAVALWIPPGESELTAESEAELDGRLEQLLGADAPRAFEMVRRFEAVKPDEPYFYLSLFGTHDDHRGKRLGMALLADNLAEIDALHSPAYLESTNPANLDRYAGVGFEPLTEFAVADGGPVVTTMWRPAR